MAVQRCVYNKARGRRLESVNSVTLSGERGTREKARGRVTYWSVKASRALLTFPCQTAYSHLRGQMRTFLAVPPFNDQSISSVWWIVNRRFKRQIPRQIRNACR